MAAKNNICKYCSSDNESIFCKNCNLYSGYRIPLKWECEECMICFDPFIKESQKCYFSCGHFICLKCSDIYKKCLICGSKKIITVKSLVILFEFTKMKKLWNEFQKLIGGFGPLGTTPTEVDIINGLLFTAWYEIALSINKNSGTIIFSIPASLKSIWSDIMTYNTKNIDLISFITFDETKNKGIYWERMADIYKQFCELYMPFIPFLLDEDRDLQRALSFCGSKQIRLTITSLNSNLYYLTVNEQILCVELYNLIIDKFKSVINIIFAGKRIGFSEKTLKDQEIKDNSSILLMHGLRGD